MNKRDVVIFGFCLTFAVLSGLLLLAGSQKYWADTFALIAALVGGTLITAKSIRALLGRNFGVDILASVAIWISILVGEYLAAAVVVIMLNGGQLLEEYVAAQSSKAIEKLIESAPLTARVRRDGLEVFTHYLHSYPGKVFRFIPMLLFSLDGLCPPDGVCLDPFSAYKGVN